MGIGDLGRLEIDGVAGRNRRSEFLATCPSLPVPELDDASGVAAGLLAPSQNETPMCLQKNDFSGAVSEQGGELGRGEVTTAILD